LTSLALTPLSNESAIFEELITKETLSPTSHLNIHQDNQGEIILFDNHKSRMYSLQSTISKVIEASATKSNTTAVGSNSYILYISLLTGLLLLSIFIYRKKADQERSTPLLDKGQVRLKYKPTTQTISLFRTNQNKAYKTLALDDIIRCEVLLNNNIINIIDDQPDNALSNQNEVEIRDLFTTEHSDKMYDDKTRHIEIILFVKDDSYTVCLYLRKGNNRVTGTKYHEVIDILIDLCWSISKGINPKATETRLIPSVKLSRPSAAVSIRQHFAPQQRKNDPIENLIQEPARSKNTVPKPASQATQQTEVVDALDKLVKLHQQGYLSDEEFGLAKTKLLQ